MVKEVGVNYINLFSGINVFMHEKDMGLPMNCIQMYLSKAKIPRIDLKVYYPGKNFHGEVITQVKNLLVLISDNIDK